MLKSVYLLVSFLALHFASLPVLGYEGNPTPGKCTYDGIELTDEKFVPAPIGECKQVKCAEGGGIEALPCPQIELFEPGEPCTYVKEDLSKPHPDCCPKVLCN